MDSVQKRLGEFVECKTLTKDLEVGSSERRELQVTPTMTEGCILNLGIAHREVLGQTNARPRRSNIYEPRWNKPMKAWVRVALSMRVAALSQPTLT